LLTGCDAVISALGPSKSESDTCSITVGNLLSAMQEKKINRYLELAGLGIDTPEDQKGLQTRLVVRIIKFFFPAVVNDRQKVYKLLSESQINWTIVRCPMIEQTDLKRTMKISLDDSPGRKVSATDLALFLIDQMSRSQYVGKCPFVAS
jgi:putative NADH-flavin reductase